MNHFDMMRSCVYGPGCLMMKCRIRNAESGIRNPEQRSKFRKVRKLLLPI